MKFSMLKNGKNRVAASSWHFEEASLDWCWVLFDPLFTNLPPSPFICSTLGRELGQQKKRWKRQELTATPTGYSAAVTFFDWTALNLRVNLPSWLPSIFLSACSYDLDGWLFLMICVMVSVAIWSRTTMWQPQCFNSGVEIYSLASIV